MDLLYFRVPGGNFGDDMNDWLWDHLLPGWRDWVTDTALIGVGTILKNGFIPEDRPKLVIGAGAGYGSIPVVSADPLRWDVRAVRGPRTAGAIGVSPKLAVLDPAALVSDFEEFRDVPPLGGTVFVPHHDTANTFDWTRICRGTGITPVSPSGDAEAIIRRIAGARHVIAESLHAAIIADTFRIPWRAVSVGSGFNHFKWEDWGESLEMEVDVTPFFPTLRKLQSTATSTRTPTADGVGQTVEAHPERRRDLKRTVKYALLSSAARRHLMRAARGPFTLSDQSVLERKKRDLWRILSEVQGQYGDKAGDGRNQS